MYGENEKDSNTYGKWEVKIQPTLEFVLKDSRKIKIDQNSKGFGELGSRIWDGGLVLARYMESLGKNDLSGKSCIELGSGTGLPSIVTLLMGSSVTITDKKSLLQLIQHNVESNIQEKEIRSKATYQELLWGTGNPFTSTFDYIIGADLTYDFDDLPPLVSTISDLSSPNTTVFIAYGLERAATPTFIELVSKNFTVELIDQSKLDFSDIYYPTFSIGMMCLKKKK